MRFGDDSLDTVEWAHGFLKEEFDTENPRMKKLKKKLQLIPNCYWITYRS